MKSQVETSNKFQVETSTPGWGLNLGPELKILGVFHKWWGFRGSWGLNWDLFEVSTWDLIYWTEICTLKCKCGTISEEIRTSEYTRSGPVLQLYTGPECTHAMYQTKIDILYCKIIWHCDSFVVWHTRMYRFLWNFDSFRNNLRGRIPFRFSRTAELPAEGDSVPCRQRSSKFWCPHWSARISTQNPPACETCNTNFRQKQGLRGGGIEPPCNK